MDSPRNPPLPAERLRAVPLRNLALSDRSMEQWISWAIRVGVLVSGAIIAAGLALLLYEGAKSSQAASLQVLRDRGAQPPSVDLHSVLAQAAHLQAVGVIELGLLALILTPIIRVAMTAVLFLLQRDRFFTVVTCLVLVILIASLAGIGS